MTVPEPRRRSPLDHRTPIADDAGSIRLAEHRFAGKLVLRGRHREVNGPCEGVLGFALPASSPQTAAGDGVTALWMSPDEWLLVTAPDGEEALEQQLAGALTGLHHQLAAVTDYYTVIRLAGIASRPILMKLTMLDLHPRAFRAGEVRGTMMTHCQALIYQAAADDAEAGPTFDIFVRWSMADYLWCLLAEAGREFGLPAQRPVSGERLVIT